MKHLEQIAAMLFAEDPRAKAEKLLASLIAESDARGGAVLAVRGERLLLYAGANVPLAMLGQLDARWSSVGTALSSGKAAELGTLLLAPLQMDSSLVGLLALEAPRSFDLQDTELLRGLVARALAGPAAGASLSAAAAGAVLGIAPAEVPSVPAHERERRRLIEMLQQHEWNIALVARKLGVTRRTVYLRIERYGIERQLVPRLMKRSPAV